MLFPCLAAEMINLKWNLDEATFSAVEDYEFVLKLSIEFRIPCFWMDGPMGRSCGLVDARMEVWGIQFPPVAPNLIGQLGEKGARPMELQRREKG